MFSSLLLTGHEDVLAQSAMLESLAQRYHQPGAMNWLEYFLSASNFKHKTPYLVLILNPAAASPPRLEDVHAAVLLFQYRPFGLPTGAYSTDDWAGFRTVIAPEAERAAMTALAADVLLDHGAQMVLLSWGEPPGSSKAAIPIMRHAAMWASAKRAVAMTLLLEPTVEATLAKLGKSTRFNLGYYRRRLHAAEPCEFVGDACGLPREEELAALNRGSLNPVDAAEFRLQYESACKLPGGFVLGLRTLQGKWLSLIGGWRQDDVTVLHWQLNAAGYEKLSVGTAMRSYFLEHEVKLGARRLIYYGGTPHSMGNSFEPEQVRDLIVRRRSLRADALYGVLRLMAWLRPYLRINSLLVQTVGNASLDWRSVEQATPVIQAQAARP